MAYPGYQPPSKTGQLKAAASRARTSKADIERDLDIARGRKEFFSNRPDVSDDRALRRMKQADELQRFKNLYTRPAGGSKTNLLQMTADAPRSLAEEEMRLARTYGPTFGEVMSDIGYGVGETMKGIGIPFVSNAARLAGGLQDVYDYLTRTRSNKTPQVGTNFAIPKSNVKDFFGSMNSGIATSPAFVPPTFDNQKITIEPLEPIQKPTSSFNNMDMSGFRADNVGLPSLIDLYNFSQNPEIKTNIGNFRFDNILRGNPQLGYGNTIMINGVPVNLNATIGREGLGLGASMTFKNGGPVDKHGGLGYKLK